jgi:hypothetical protein
VLLCCYAATAMNTRPTAMRLLRRARVRRKDAEQKDDLETYSVYGSCDKASPELVFRIDLMN